jgi:hypothetical protein
MDPTGASDRAQSTPPGGAASLEGQNSIERDRVRPGTGRAWIAVTKSRAESPHTARERRERHMPEDGTHRGGRKPSLRLYDLVLWLAFFGMVISLSRNVYQDRKLGQLESDFAGLRQQSQKQIGELRDAQSASLEQDLLRLDQLSTQLTKTNEDVLRQATSLANRNKSDLIKTVEQRHQEMISAISDLRADLRSDTNAKLNQPAPAPKLRLNQEPQHPATEVVLANSTPAPPATASPVSLASSAVHDDESPAPSPKKKKFWSRLNPFSRKKPESGANGL